MSRRFRAFYIGALVVAGIGLLGTSFIPHAEAAAAARKATVHSPVSAKQARPATAVGQRTLSEAQAENERSVIETTTPSTPNPEASSTVPASNPLKPLVGLLGLSSLSFAGLLALATRSA